MPPCGTRRPEERRQHGDGSRDRRRVVHDAVLDDGERGQERDVRRQRHVARRVAAIEDQPLGGEAIQVRCRDRRVPVGAEVVGAQRVHRDEDDVRARLAVGARAVGPATGNCAREHHGQDQSDGVTHAGRSHNGPPRDRQSRSPHGSDVHPGAAHGKRIDRWQRDASTRSCCAAGREHACGRSPGRSIRSSSWRSRPSARCLQETILRTRRCEPLRAAARGGQRGASLHPRRAAAARSASSRRRWWSSRSDATRRRRRPSPRCCSRRTIPTPRCCLMPADHVIAEPDAFRDAVARAPAADAAAAGHLRHRAHRRRTPATATSSAARRCPASPGATRSTASSRSPTPRRAALGRERRATTGTAASSSSPRRATSPSWSGASRPCSTRAGARSRRRARPVLPASRRRRVRGVAVELDRLRRDGARRRRRRRAGRMGWSDVGSWAALWEISDKDGAGNAMQGHGHRVDVTDSLLRTDGPAIAAVGLRDVVLVATKDAVLAVAATAPRTCAKWWSSCARAGARSTCRTPGVPALGLVRDHRPGTSLPGEAAGGEPRAEALAPDAPPPRRALGGGAGHRPGRAQRGNDPDRGERVGLHPERHAAPAREPGPDTAAPRRGADRRVPRRGRHRALRRRLRALTRDAGGADPRLAPRRGRPGVGRRAGPPPRLLAHRRLEARRGVAPRRLRDRRAPGGAATGSRPPRPAAARRSWRRIWRARGVGSSGARSSTRRSAWRASWRGGARRRARPSSPSVRPRDGDVSAGSGTRPRG